MVVVKISQEVDCRDEVMCSEMSITVHAVA